MGSTENTKLCDFTSHKNNDFIFTPIAPPATSAPSYEIKPALLNLVMKEQFSGAREDVVLHLNNFVELCDVQKYKEVDGDIDKLKLFPFSLRERSKECVGERGRKHNFFLTYDFQTQDLCYAEASNEQK